MPEMNSSSSGSLSPIKSKRYFPKKGWYVYTVLTSLNKVYTGITVNVSKRLDMHNAGRGSKALRGQLPVVLLWASGPMGHSLAVKLEAGLKKLKHHEKFAALAAS
jgi:putative endonuclease